MILGTYRNPPYRSPTTTTRNENTVLSNGQAMRKKDHQSRETVPASSAEAAVHPTANRTSNGNGSSTTSPRTSNVIMSQQAHQENDPSPKRKRDSLPPLSTISPLRRATTPPMTLNTNFERALSPPVGVGADSPRSKVAARFEKMEIRGGPVSGASGLGFAEAVQSAGGMEPRKRMRFSPSPGPVLSAMEVERGSREDSDVVRGGTRTPPPAARTQENAAPSATPEVAMHDLEIGEKPNAYSPIASSTSPSSSTTSPTSSKLKSSRPRSPPPPSSTSELSSSDPTSLTWQPSEITGHNYDPTTALLIGDDGTGLNGIGFRPTPAIAYARAQKRRAQVSEWKAREAREARGRRAERRLGGSGSAGGSRDGRRRSDEERGRRTVRFVG